MKHLKRFNESLSEDDFNELKEFCESCLAYLLDEGLEIEVQKGYKQGYEIGLLTYPF